jgi:Uma2 family endonuclease
MEAKRSHKRWTYDEYAKLPESGTTRYEVIDGELAVTPSPTSTHQRIVTRLVLDLGSFVQRHRLGEVFAGPLDVLFGEGDYLQPDFLFVRTENAQRLSKRGVEGPPDLVVEILSTSTAQRDRGVKLARYRHFGVPEYWIIDPSSRTIEVWRLSARADSPEILRVGEELSWTPLEGGPTLQLAIEELIPVS